MYVPPLHIHVSILIDMLHRRFSSHGTSPKLVNVTLERGNNVSVVVFDFLEMIRSLLSDPHCMREENLTFPSDNSFEEPPENDTRDEIHSGSWDKESWKRRCRRNGEFLLALPIFIDSSNTDVFGKLKIEPVQFTLSMFTRECRRNFNFWRPLGFINDLSLSKSCEDVNINRGNPWISSHDSATNLRNYYLILSTIFKSLKEVQDGGGFLHEHPYKKNV